MSDDPNYDPATTAAALAPSQPVSPAVNGTPLQRLLASMSVAFARITALEKQMAELVPAVPGPLTNTPATHAATEAAQAAGQASVTPAPAAAEPPAEPPPASPS